MGNGIAKADAPATGNRRMAESLFAKRRLEAEEGSTTLSFAQLAMVRQAFGALDEPTLAIVRHLLLPYLCQGDARSVK